MRRTPEPVAWATPIHVFCTAAMGSGRPPPDAEVLREAEVFPFAALLVGALRPVGRVLPFGRVEAPLVLREVVDGRVAMIRRLGESHP